MYHVLFVQGISSLSCTHTCRLCGKQSSESRPQGNITWIRCEFYILIAILPCPRELLVVIGVELCAGGRVKRVLQAVHVAVSDGFLALGVPDLVES